MTYQERERIVGHHATALGEHFDAVVILTCVAERDHTQMHSAGHGNYYAKRGMVTEWITREDERSRIDVRPSCDVDDGDDWKQGAGI